MTEKLRKLLRRILLAINVLLALALLLSYLAALINPGDFALPAFFGLAYPYILFLNILIVIAWAMLLRYEAFISLAVILLGFGHFINYIQLFRTKADKQGTFMVLSYNVRMFNNFEKGSNSRNQVFKFLKSKKPDIFCLQEYFITGNPSQIQTIVNNAVEGKYYSHVKMLGSGKNRYYGIATFSRFPIINKGEIIHSHSSSLSIYTDVVIKKDTFRIYNNHLQSFRLKRMERSFIDEITDEKETIDDVMNLSSRLKKGFQNRALQSQVVKDNIRKSPYPVIVAGDFNDTPVSYTYRKLRKGLKDSFVSSGYGAGFTYKGNYPPNRIDYILYDESLISSYFEIVRIKYSDHYPVAAYFRKKPK